MTMPRTYKTETLAAVHEMIEGLHEAGAVDKRTLREFDEACLVPATPLQPEEIKAIREAENVSQPVFARYLNVSKNLVSDWERGKKRPGGPALRLLSIIQRKGLGAVA
ncbi:transcriptional regulator [Novosphingobium colocasiae]|uniref:Transcriptional regulator n=2 Tax=Novosphingobium colocasiae TaxID=1256513 RepID=A0A918PBQ9_9SPHN|nr:transcriptional regulator [Novosphingobium colocasiae]